MEEERLLLTVDEAAHRLGIGRSHAYIFVMRGDLPSVKLGRSRRVRREDLDRFIDGLATEGHPDG